MKQSYSTKQKQLLMSFLENNENKDFSASQIHTFLSEKGMDISRATVYRNLNKLENEGIIKKYPLKKGKETAFQFCGEKNFCDSHFHLKCLKCDKLVHLECEETEKLTGHILKEHRFKVSKCDTLLYGYCENCSK